MDWDRAMDRDYIPADGNARAETLVRLERLGDPVALQALRVSQQALRIAAETEGKEATTKSTRGTPQRVVCLTLLGRNGKPREFGSVTEAADAVKASRVHHVRNAILRGGTCKGHKFAYVKAA